MSQYTRLHAARLLAAALGSGSEQVALWLCGWSAHEIQCGVGCSHPANNLWACGQSMPGSSTWNPPHHVQNYPTLAEGIAATVINLHNGLYPHLVNAIAASNMTALESSSGVQADLRTWCGSECYSKETGSFLADGQAHASDLFDESGGGNTALFDVQPASDVGSCRWCLIGLPGACPTDQICVGMNSDGTVYIPTGTDGLTQFAGTCVTNAYFQSHSQNPDGSAIGKKDSADSPTVCQKIAGGSQPAPPVSNPGVALGNVLDFLSSRSSWQRILKFVLGLVVLGFGLLLIFSILTGKAESNPAVQGAARIAELAGG